MTTNDPHGGSPYRPPPPPGPEIRHSSMSMSAFVIALVGFFIGWLPFAGLLGTLGLIMAIVDLRSVDPLGAPQRHSLSRAAVALGTLSTIAAGLWAWVVVSVVRSPPHASCPHLYSFDGRAYRLDADLASGALYGGAERDDTDRLESLRPVDGEYRLRIQDDLEETDHIDRFALRVVDAPTDVEVLPLQSGRLVGVRGATAPVRAVDARGEDVLGLLIANDGRSLGETQSETQSETQTTSGDPRERWTLEFQRPPTARGVLVVRGHSTPFAERAFVHYLATMGQGVRPLMEWAHERSCECYRAYLSEEITRLGLPLGVGVSSRGAWHDLEPFAPTSPAIARSQAMLIELPGDGDRVVVRLEATPRFWEIDQIELAPDAAPVTANDVAPVSATTGSGADVLGLLRASDERRAVLKPGEWIDVRFAVPPPSEGAQRTVVADLRGFYAMDVGGRRGVDPVRLLEHRFGVISLPRFAQSLAAAPRDP